jgi:hypothetical protein
VKFTRNKDGLYVYRPSKGYLTEVANSDKEPIQEMKMMIQSVNENMKGYTQRQFEDAKQARKLYHIIGCPTVENFKPI